MNHLESPKVFEKVLDFLMLIMPKIVKFPPISRKPPFIVETWGTI